MKALLAILVSCTSLFFSCLKADLSEKVYDKSEIEALYKSISSLSSAHARQVTFQNLLSDEERAAFFLFRLEEILTSNKLNDQQMLLVNQVKDYIKPDIYDPSSNFHNAFQAFQFKWINEAKDHFDANMIFHLFMSFETNDEYKSKLVVTNLSQYSDEDEVIWCNCNALTNSLGIGCELEGKCVKGSCVVISSVGCGIGWGRSCDGMCEDNEEEED